VERFNSRRYGRLYPALAVDPSEQRPKFTAVTNSSLSDEERLLGGMAAVVDVADFEPFDNDLQSVLGESVELSARFRHNYRHWVDQEVIYNKIDWDQLLVMNRGMAEEVGSQ